MPIFIHTTIIIIIILSCYFQLTDTPAYYVVRFLLDEAVCCIPHGMIVDTTTAIGEKCKVKYMRHLYLLQVRNSPQN